MQKHVFIAISVLAVLFGLFSFRQNHELRSEITQPVTYYVSVDGNDTNSGKSITTPLKTISAATARMNEGDVCMIREGTYRERVTISKSNLTISAYQDEPVYISGLDEVRGWKPHKAGIYQATFSPEEKDNTSSPWHLAGKGKYFIQVFCEKKLMHESRFPNWKGNILEWKNHGDPVTVSPSGNIVFNGTGGGLNQIPDLSGAIFHAIIEQKFNAVQGIVKSKNGNAAMCEAITGGWKKSSSGEIAEYLFLKNGNKVDGMGQGFVFHHLNLLDTDQEWFWDKSSGTLYFNPAGNQDPNTLLIEAKSRKTAIEIKNASNVKINDINIVGAGLEIQSSSNCRINQCNITYPIPSYVHQDEYNGKSAFVVTGDKNQITNCYVAHSWGSGIEITDGSENIVENNLIEDVDWMGTYNAGVRAGGTNTKITRNTIRRSGRFLIQGIGVKNGDVSLNHLHHGMLIGQDGGAFYTYVQDGQGTTISNNWIHDVIGVPWERSVHKDHNVSVGVYLDGGCQNFNVVKNVIWNTRYAIMYNATPGGNERISSNNKMNYNTCFVSGQSSIVSKNDERLYRGNEMIGNLSNKHIGGLGVRKENLVDEEKTKSQVSQLKRGGKQNITYPGLGAYQKDKPSWTAGADTTQLLKRRNVN